MDACQKEIKRLKRIKAFVTERFPHFGQNKKQEILRLVYEISKRENLSPANLIHGAQTHDFSEIKQYLISRRFPYAHAHY